MNGWIGVDLDGTLAHYDQFRGHEHIGEPIMPMVERVKKWLAEGRDVRIFTARVGGTDAEAHRATLYIDEWAIEHIGQALPVTCRKDFQMIELWDDRCVQVMPNTGKTVTETHNEFLAYMNLSLADIKDRVANFEEAFISNGK